jgi:hypothetical protein
VPEPAEDNPALVDDEACVPVALLEPLAEVLDAIA